MENDRKRKWQTAGEVCKENTWFFVALLFFDCFCFFCLWLLDNRKVKNWQLCLCFLQL